MPTLSAAAINTLRAKGFSQSLINQYLAGKVSASVFKSDSGYGATSESNKPRSTKPTTSTNTGNSYGATSVTNMPKTTAKLSSTSTGLKTGSYIPGAPAYAQPGYKAPKGNAPSTGKTATSTSSMMEQIAKKYQNVQRPAADYLANPGYSDAAPAVGSGSSIGGFDTGSFNTGTYTAPTISMRDFTDQANALAAAAYGPVYAALNQGKTNAQGQYNTSDTVVAGLYDKLVSDTKASGVQQAAQYDQQSQDAGARTQALSDRLGQNYQGTAQSEAALLQQLGQQQAAPEILADNTKDQNFQQGQAAQQGAAQQAGWAQQKQGAQDYTTAIANANTTQGTVAREGLLRDLSSVLQQYDSQAAGYQLDQAKTGIDIGQKLSAQDLSAQEANASGSLGAFQANSSNANNAAQLQQSAAQLQFQQQQAQQDASLKSRQQTIDNANSATQLKIAQQNADNGTPTSQIDPPTDPVSQVRTNLLATGVPANEVGSYYDVYDSVIQTGLPNGLDGENLQSFVMKAAAAAGIKGLDQGKAAAGAALYWQKVMNRS